jgi:hypothetical protein
MQSSTVLSFVSMLTNTNTTIMLFYAIILLLGICLTSWFAYTHRPKGRPWYVNPWLLLPVSILFISPVILLHIPILIMVPLYLALAIGIFFLSKRSNEIWYRNPLLIILFFLSLILLFRGTFLTVIVLVIAIIGVLSIVKKKIFKL